MSLPLDLYENVFMRLGNIKNLSRFVLCFSDDSLLANEMDKIIRIKFFKIPPIPDVKIFLRDVLESFAKTYKKETLRTDLDFTLTDNTLTNCLFHIIYRAERERDFHKYLLAYDGSVYYYGNLVKDPFGYFNVKVLWVCLRKVVKGGNLQDIVLFATPDDVFNNFTHLLRFCQAANDKINNYNQVLNDKRSVFQQILQDIFETDDSKSPSTDLYSIIYPLSINGLYCLDFQTIRFLLIRPYFLRTNNTSSSYTQSLNKNYIDMISKIDKWHQANIESIVFDYINDLEPNIFSEQNTTYYCVATPESHVYSKSKILLAYYNMFNNEFMYNALLNVGESMDDPIIEWILLPKNGTPASANLDKDFVTKELDAYVIKNFDGNIDVLLNENRIFCIPDEYKQLQAITIYDSVKDIPQQIITDMISKY